MMGAGTLHGPEVTRYMLECDLIEAMRSSCASDGG